MQAAHLFASDTDSWLRNQDDSLSSVTSDLQQYCDRVKCDDTVPAAIKLLKNLGTDVSNIRDAFDSESSTADNAPDSTATGAISASASDEDLHFCPSTACLNLELLWFLDESGCVCDTKAIQDVASEATKGVALSKWLLVRHMLLLCNFAFTDTACHAHSKRPVCCSLFVRSWSTETTACLLA